MAYLEDLEGKIRAAYLIILKTIQWRCLSGIFIEEIRTLTAGWQRTGRG
jgi:hypothetical protein